MPHGKVRPPTRAHMCAHRLAEPHVRVQTHPHVFSLAMRRCCSVHRCWPHNHHHRHRRSRRRRRLAASCCSAGAALAHTHRCVCGAHVGPRQRLKAAAFVGIWVFCRWGMPRVSVGCCGAAQKRMVARMYPIAAWRYPGPHGCARGVNKCTCYCEFIPLWQFQSIAMLIIPQEGP